MRRLMSSATSDPASGADVGRQRQHRFIVTPCRAFSPTSPPLSRPSAGFAGARDAASRGPESLLSASIRRATRLKNEASGNPYRN
jgi:hypothetical protein